MPSFLLPDREKDDHDPTYVGSAVQVAYIGPDFCPICGDPLNLTVESIVGLTDKSYNGTVYIYPDKGLRIDDVCDYSNWRISCNNQHVIATSIELDNDRYIAPKLYWQKTPVEETP